MSHVGALGILCSWVRGTFCEWGTNAQTVSTKRTRRSFQKCVWTYLWTSSPRPGGGLRHRLHHLPSSPLHHVVQGRLCSQAAVDGLAKFSLQASHRSLQMFDVAFLLASQVAKFF